MKAIRNGEKSLTVFSGYAFNQLKAGDISGAKALFELMMNQQNTYGNYFDKEPETGLVMKVHKCWPLESKPCQNYRRDKQMSARDTEHLVRALALPTCFSYILDE